MAAASRPPWAAWAEVCAKRLWRAAWATVKTLKSHAALRGPRCAKRCAVAMIGRAARATGSRAIVPPASTWAPAATGAHTSANPAALAARIVMSRLCTGRSSQKIDKYQ